LSAAVNANGVGGRVADARRGFGLTQKQFAERLGITLWLVDRIEAGTADAALHLPRIAEVTGKPETWFSGPSPAAVVGAPRRGERVVSSLRGSQNTGRDLVLAAFALLVLVRFFTEVVPILPRAANFADIPIFLVLSVAALTRPRTGTRPISFAAPVLLFACLCVISVALNLSRVGSGPVVVFLYGFVAPIGVYAAAYRLWPTGHALSLSRLLVALGITQLLVVGLIDLPRFVASGNPDVVSGTFGTNAYQLVFFLLVFTGLLAGIFTFEKERLTSRLALPLFGAILATILLAQYRALLVTTAVTVLFIGLLLGTRGRAVVASTVVAASFAISLSYIAQHFPDLKFAPTLATLEQRPGFYVSKRLDAADSVIKLYNDHPSFMLSGTGPGTFSSRAWQTFANANSSSASNVQGRYVKALTGGAAYHTDVSDKYVIPTETVPAVGGSTALSSPYSSYLSLLAEVGIAGFLLLTGIYVVATVRSTKLAGGVSRRPKPRDPLPALALACACGFFVLLQMGFLANWLEVTRVTFPIWMLFAVVTKEATNRNQNAA
jgi:transcriptional regulator with XRE-family HTH domain